MVKALLARLNFSRSKSTLMSSQGVNERANSLRFPSPFTLKHLYMAVFARRSIQRMLQETSQLLSKTEMQKLVSRLNGDDHRQALATEWELVVFFAFSNLGTVQYEPELGGKKQPDIAFTLFGDNEISFVADVTTVSDRGLEEANPLERLSKELIRLVEKLR